MKFKNFEVPTSNRENWPRRESMIKVSRNTVTTRDSITISSHNKTKSNNLRYYNLMHCVLQQMKSNAYKHEPGNWNPS